MFARVTVYEVPGDRMEEAVERFRDALDQIASLDGFSDGYFLVSPDDDRATAVTLWETHAAMQASSVTASRVRTEAARSVGGAVVSAHEYRVAVEVAAEREGAPRYA